MKGLEVKLVEASDPDLEAQWEEAPLVGSPQPMPQSPCRHPQAGASAQEQSVSLKRRKGAALLMSYLWCVNECSEEGCQTQNIKRQAYCATIFPVP